VKPFERLHRLFDRTEGREHYDRRFRARLARLRQQDAFARMSFACAGTIATPIEARHRRRNDCWRPDCCRRNLEAQLQRASKNAEMEILAIGMIGEGVIGAIRPRRYMRLWRFGPKAYRNFIDALADHPQTPRLMCAAEAGLGVWLALRNAR